MVYFRLDTINKIILKIQTPIIQTTIQEVFVREKNQEEWTKKTKIKQKDKIKKSVEKIITDKLEEYLVSILSYITKLNESTIKTKIKNDKLKIYFLALNKF